MKPALVPAVLVVVVDLMGYVALGAWGVLTASVCSALVVAAVVRGSVRAPIRQPRRSPSRDSGAAAFTSYRQISAMIDWTTHNEHYFGAVTRPFLAATAAALLSQRHRVALETEVASARRLLGPDVWALVDPTGVRDSSTPLAREDLARVVHRLEQL